MKAYIKLLIVVLILLVPILLLEADDKELFMGLGINTSTVKPNVIILMDTSKAMNNVVWYPRYGLDGIAGNEDDGFNPREIYTGVIDDFGDSGDRYWETGKTLWQARWIVNGDAKTYANSEMGGNWTGCYADDGTVNPTRFQVGGNSPNFTVGERILYRGVPGESDALATIKDHYQDATTGQWWFELTDIVGGPIVAGAVATHTHHFQRMDETAGTPVIVKLYGGVDQGYNALYDRNYLKWVYIHASDTHRAAVSHFSQYGTFDTTDFTGWQASACSTGGTTFDRYVFTRIQVAREVACRVAEDSVQIVNLGLFKFNADVGATVMDQLNDMSEQASLLVDYKKSIYTKMVADSESPMAEALVDVWYYYRPGPGSKTYFPVNQDTAASSTHKVEYWCQSNYVILVSSGESTYDQFTGDGHLDGSMFATYPVRRQDTWADWPDGWGDTDLNDIKELGGIPESYAEGSATYCPNWSCWQRTQTDGSDREGSDYLDDVAYFMANSDLFPEQSNTGVDLYTEWSGVQRIFTYTIGFNADNDLLRAAAVNGDGAYFTASTYEELVQAFRNVITSILLRNFAFSAITAPKKTATASSQTLAMSYVGYFLPSQASPLWEGHLLAYRLLDKWGYDADNSGTIEMQEYIYDTEQECAQDSTTGLCTRLIQLSDEQDWDAADKMPLNRSLYTEDGTGTLMPFDKANFSMKYHFFGSGVSSTEAEFLIDKIRSPRLGDVFHSDVGFVGPPLLGKTYMPHINSLDPNGEPFMDFYEAKKDRRRVLYVGTNDGIMHMFYADDITYADNREAGQEVWGFIPYEVLPSLKKIVIDGQHTYTTDGRITAEDIYYKQGTDNFPSWATVLCFGLREGGDHYYQLNISDVSTQPTFMWKFHDPVYSAQSWGKPVYGRIKLKDTSASTGYSDKWVVLLTGGFAFNNEVASDLRGKAIFMVDAGTGDLLWMIGYDPTNGAAVDAANPDLVQTLEDTNDSAKQLTADPLFNFPFAASLTAIDRDFDGYLDTIYYGNTGGNMFKTDVSPNDMSYWQTKVLYKSNVETTKESDITAIAGNDITVRQANGFTVGDTIVGETSGAMGFIGGEGENQKILVVKTLRGTFQVGEYLLIKKYDPIFISPAAAFDTCYNLWLAFGTGDRDRPRTNYVGGRCIVLKDNEVLGHTLSDSNGNSTIPGLTLNNDAISSSAEDITITNGFFFNFPDDKEKLFDPEPVIIPDENLVPHIYLNTYQPPVLHVTNQDDPCDIPEEGSMRLYDIQIANCGEVAGERIAGRIAGGGTYQGQEYVMYIGTGGVASVPPLESTSAKKLPYPGGIVFWKEKKR